MFHNNIGNPPSKKRNLGKYWRHKARDAKLMKARLLRTLHRLGAQSGLSYWAPTEIMDWGIERELLFGETNNSMYKLYYRRIENVNWYVYGVLENIGVSPLGEGPLVENQDGGPVEANPPAEEPPVEVQYPPMQDNRPVVDPFPNGASPKALEFIQVLLDRPLEDQDRFLVSLHAGAQNNILQCGKCQKVCKSRGGLKNHRNRCVL